jgi:hypothetical protein
MDVVRAKLAEAQAYEKTLNPKTGKPAKRAAKETA